MSTYCICFPLSDLPHLVQFSSFAQSCLTFCDPMDCTARQQASLSITNSRSLFKPMSIKSVMPSNYLILCHLLLLLPQSFLASGSFPMSQFFTSGGWSIGTSALSRPLGAGKCSEHSRTKRRMKYEKQCLKLLQLVRLAVEVRQGQTMQGFSSPHKVMSSCPKNNKKLLKGLPW